MRAQTEHRILVAAWGWGDGGLVGWFASSSEAGRAKPHVPWLSEEAFTKQNSAEP